jgi:hypothetical protein
MKRPKNVIPAGDRFIPSSYRKAMKKCFGKTRMKRLASKYPGINSLRLLHYLKLVYYNSTIMEELETAKIIPIFDEKREMYTVEMKVVPEDYRRVIRDCFGLKRAKKICHRYDLITHKLVHYLERAHCREVTFEGFSWQGVPNKELDETSEQYLANLNILPPIYECHEEILWNEASHHSGVL